MPWSDSHSYIFIAIPKTGTTSMVHLLRKMHEQHGGGLSLVDEKVDKTFRKKYRLDEIGDKQPGHSKHLSAIQLKYILGDRYAECFSFSLVRNPWARTVSRYYYHHVDFMPSKAERIRRGTSRKFHNKDFDSWIIDRWKTWKKNKNAFRSQLSKLVDLDGQIIVDHVGKLESFQESYDLICQKIGVPNATILHVNGTKKTHYSALYKHESKEMVHEMCQVDIEKFDYAFENLTINEG